MPKSSLKKILEAQAEDAEKKLEVSQYVKKLLDFVQKLKDDIFKRYNFKYKKAK